MRWFRRDRRPEVWEIADDEPPLGDYYLAAMDAIDAWSPGEAIFFIQVCFCSCVECFCVCV